MMANSKRDCRDQLLQCVELPQTNAVADFQTSKLTLDYPGLFEILRMLRNGRLGQRQSPPDLTTDTRRTVDQ